MRAEKKFTFLKNPYFYLSLTFLVWWLFGFYFIGKDLYLIPFTFFVILIFIKILKEPNYNFLEEAKNFFLSHKKIIKIIIYIQLVVSFLGVGLMYLSIQASNGDLAFYHNYIINFLDTGTLVNFDNTTNYWGDHFTPSFLIIVLPFYYIKENLLWILFIKAFCSYLLIPSSFYFLCKYFFTSKDKVYWVTTGLSLLWCFFYIPSTSIFFAIFQPSSFAPVLIFLAFYLMKEKKYFWFYLIMIFIIGLKEHMAVVLVGFGLYLVFNEPQEKKTGIIYILIGIFLVFFLTLFVVPFFRTEYQNVTATIAPFSFVFEKVKYFFKLLIPLGLLPLLHWRKGIIALPAIAINLVSGKNIMITSDFHHDDISSTMLFLSMILIFSEKDIFPKWIKSFSNSKKYKLMIINLYWFIVAAITGFFLIKASFIHHFNFKDKNAYTATANFIPTKETLAVLRELDIINQYDNSKIIYSQTGLKGYINSKNIRHIFIKNFAPVINDQCDVLPESKRKNSLYVFHEEGSPFFIKNLKEGSPIFIKNLKQCLPIIENNNPDLKRLKKFKHLIVFEY